MIGRLLGPFVKSRSLKTDDPMPRNMPITKWEIVSDERDIEAERQRLRGLIDRFAAGGPERCTTHPYSFFGPLTPEEWARWMYKHRDHHLRQFQGVASASEGWSRLPGLSPHVDRSGPWSHTHADMPDDACPARVFPWDLT